MLPSMLVPGKINKANALSRHPDYKEGIASENAETIFCFHPRNFLLKLKQFHIQVLCLFCLFSDAEASP